MNRAKKYQNISEVRYRTLFDWIEHGFCVFEMILNDAGEPVDYLFLETNSVFEQWTGLIGAEGKTALELILDDKKKWVEIYGRVARTGEPVRFEDSFAPVNRWFDVYAWRLGGDANRQVAAVFRDITANKQARDAMRESEERFRAFVNATSDIVYEMSADWREMRFLKGKEFIATTENPRDDWSEEYIPDDEKPRVRATIRQAIETRTNFELEHRVIRLDGTTGWTFSRAIPVLDEGGKIVKWFGTASDITERKRISEGLRHNEQMFSALIENAPFGIYMIDADFRLRTINAGSRAVFSNIQPLIGRDFAEILRIIWEEPFATEAIERFRHTLRNLAADCRTKSES